ncbi:MAG: NfeD family protein [Variibacter sp.]|jgi:membrane protein implicated in regulation of membrane protease activity
MIESLAGLGVWNWFILAGVLLAFEIMAPGTFMLWLGLSAVAVGVLSLLIAWPWQAQLVTFAVLAIASIIVWRRLSPKTEELAAQPFLNRRADSFVGRAFTLEKPIIDGNGTVRIGDTIWQVRGPDLPAGSRITVTGADGATLVVAKAEG